MKSLFAILAISFISFCAAAQSEGLGCIDKDMRVQAEGLKASFTNQGLTLFKDAMVTMESQQPMPVAIQMVKGRIYQMIFLGTSNATKMTMEIMDGDHKLLARKETQKGGSQSIVYSFIPERTDEYLVVLYQKFKGRSACGSFTLMHDAPVAPKQAEVAPKPVQQQKKTPLPPPRK